MAFSEEMFAGYEVEAIKRKFERLTFGERAQVIHSVNATPVGPFGKCRGLLGHLYDFELAEQIMKFKPAVLHTEEG